MKVGLVAYNWEADTSLALWNLVTYARQDDAITRGVQFSEYCSATPKSGIEEEEKLFAVLKWIDQGGFDIVGFSCYIWNIKFVNRVAQAVKELWPHVTILYGGQQIRGYYVRQVFERERCVDICVINEAEVTFRDLLLHFLTGKPALSEIGGLAYVAPPGTVNAYHKLTGGNCDFPEGSRIHMTGDPRIVDELGRIPSPYLGGIDLPMGGAFLYEASRGCPYQCSFCIWGESKGVREYDMERVEQELTNILHHQPSHIMFCDGTFNMRRERAAKILGILAEHLREGRVKPFSLLLELKLEIIDDRLAAVMDELVRLNPLVTFEFGLQSASQEAATRMRRPFSEDRFRRAWDRLSDRLKSSAIIDCIYGLPGDGIEQFKATVDFSYSLAPHRIQCFRLSILPGSQFERQAEEYGLKFMREPNHMVYETEWLDLDQMAWIETFGFAVADLYHFHGTLIKCLLGLGGRTGVGAFSDLITRFVDWAGRDGILGTSYAGNRPEGRWRAIDLSRLFERFAFAELLPAGGVTEPRILDRLHDLFRYEAGLGRIAVNGLASGAEAADGRDGTWLYAHADVLHSRYDIPGLIGRARGRAQVDILEMEERDSYMALTQKAGHQDVRVPISYRINATMASLLDRFRNGGMVDEVGAEGTVLLPAIRKLQASGLLVPAAHA